MTDNIRESTRISLSLGPLLRQRRQQLGLSLANLEKLSGIPQPTLSRIESGRLALSVDNLCALYGPLKLDLNRLAEGLPQVRVTEYESLRSLVDALSATATPEQMEIPRTFLRLFLNSLAETGA